MIEVLVAIPAKSNMHPKLFRTMEKLSNQLVNNNPDMNLDIVIFTETFKRNPGKSIYVAPAQARNLLLEKHLKPHHDYVMWIDADIVDYPKDLIYRLHKANPDGVSAPLILIEKHFYTEESLNRSDWFYDVAAFVEKGRPVFSKAPHFGNVSHFKPYFKNLSNIVECECVGCSYLIPTSVYKEDVEYYPTPFTDHWPVIRKAIDMGMKVVCVRDILAYHAYLPRYNEEWHVEDMKQWTNWGLNNYYSVVNCSRLDWERPERKKPSGNGNKLLN